MTTAHEIGELVRRHVTDEIACEVTSQGQRVACLTPLEYPDGDGVVVWIEAHRGDFHVSDYGHAFSDTASRPAQDYKALADHAERISRQNALRFVRETVVGRATQESLGEVIWRVASAAAQIAVVVATYQPRRHPRSRTFAREVERDLRGNDFHVERDRKLEGQSGHAHTATIYLPDQEIIVEPVGGTGNWNQVSTVYAKFGDLTLANGYRPYTLVDDRQRTLSVDIANMLVQVSRIVRWSDRRDWIESLRHAQN